MCGIVSTPPHRRHLQGSDAERAGTSMPICTVSERESRAV
jgi:hypothetical protein